MAVQQNHPGSACKTGVRCAVCSELIPAGSGHEIHTREMGDVIYHFATPIVISNGNNAELPIDRRNKERNINRRTTW